MQVVVTVETHLTSLWSRLLRALVTAHCEDSWSLSLTLWNQ